ncbi:MAG: apbE [Verrucomicrobiaceae bacterium]|nr:apbE [Verrucomicrobiaceae bacterium]
MTTEAHRFAHEAMNTEFEVIIAQPGMAFVDARNAALMMFQEITRLEEELSRFKPTSEIWRLSLLKAAESTVVDYATWDCLNLARAVYEETEGAFDITVGPLMKMWRNPDGSPRTPSAEEITATRSRVGGRLYDLDPETQRVTVHADSMMFDLGALGKGYALDQSVRVLNDWGVQTALLNAGESTILGIGDPPESEGWPVDLHLGDEPRTILLRDSALSCSGFAVQGNHLMNPRTGEPVPVREKRSYVLAASAALSDALSTAFMIMEPEEASALCAKYPGVELLG